MKTATEIIKEIQEGSLKSEEIVRECLDRIEKEDDDIGAFLEIFKDEALKRAREIDEMRLRGEELPRLAGLPIAIKDNICFAEHTASAGSNMLKNHKATYSASVVNRLLEAGAVIVGRTNMDEFAMGSSNESSAFQITKNPYDKTKVPGGSSGGSAAAVSAGFVPVALGSDTGGSIRQPASLCGVVGMKPSYGRVSRYGLIAMASSLDQIGPITQTVEDASLILEVIEGKDKKDATSVELNDVTVPELLNNSLKGKRIGVAKEFMVDTIDSEILKRFNESLQIMKDAGAEIVDVSFPLAKYALPTYYIIMPAEVSSNLARFDGMRYGDRAVGDGLMDSYKKARGQGFGKEVKRRIMLGNYILSAGYFDAYYKKALAVKTALHDSLDDIFKDIDVLVSPTSPAVAWNIGEKFNDPITMYLMDIFTITANITSIPAISVPCGLAHDLPVGLQIMGRKMDDNVVLEVANVYEKLTNWNKKTI